MNASDLIKALNLAPLPWEGGWFVETYRSQFDIPTKLLGQQYVGDTRQLGTAIFYLLTPETISRLHRVASDEVFHFYLGDPVEQLRLYPDGSSEVVVLGHDILNGHHVQSVVRAGVMQGARLIGGGAFALMGTTVTPGFAFEDFALGDKDDLTKQFPDRADLISALT